MRIITKLLFVIAFLGSVNSYAEVTLLPLHSGTKNKNIASKKTKKTQGKAARAPMEVKLVKKSDVKKVAKVTKAKKVNRSLASWSSSAKLGSKMPEKVTPVEYVAPAEYKIREQQVVRELTVERIVVGDLGTKRELVSSSAN